MMKDEDIFSGLLDGPWSLNTKAELHAFGRLFAELEAARKEKRRGDAVGRAVWAGLEYGVFLCRRALEADSQWSDIRAKREWEKHYGYCWKTIAKHVRWRKLTARLAQVHKDDLQKTWH